MNAHSSVKTPSWEIRKTPRFWSSIWAISPSDLVWKGIWWITTIDKQQKPCDAYECGLQRFGIVCLLSVGLVGLLFWKDYTFAGWFSSMIGGGNDNNNDNETIIESYKKTADLPICPWVVPAIVPLSVGFRGIFICMLNFQRAARFLELETLKCWLLLYPGALRNDIVNTKNDNLS